MAAQRLGTEAFTSAADVLNATGWVRTLGGVDAYLSLRARAPNLSVDDVHAELASGQLRVVPAARGCIYLVPATDATLALALAERLWRKRIPRDLEKAGSSLAEVEALGAPILAALADGPRTTPQLKAALGSRVPSLGAAGKKVGISSLLPPALRLLEFQHELSRTTVTGRLDTETYLWSRRTEDDAAESFVAEALAQALATRLLRWFGPITVDNASGFTGLGKTPLKRALAALGTPTDDGFVAADQQLPAPSPGPHFLPGFDNVMIWLGGPTRFVAEADLDRPTHIWGMSKHDKTWRNAKHTLTRTVIHQGRVVGIWEFDPDAQRVVVGAYSPGLPAAAEAEAERVGHFLTTLGNARAFSLGTDDRLRARCETVRKTS